MTGGDIFVVRSIQSGREGGKEGGREGGIYFSFPRVCGNEKKTVFSVGSVFCPHCVLFIC